MRATKDMVGKTLVWQERADAKSAWEPEQSAKIDRVSGGDCACYIPGPMTGTPSLQWIGVNDESGIYLRVVEVK